MKKVGIPYEIREEKLYMSSILWSQKCLCCGSEKDTTMYDLEHKARYESTASGTTTTSSYYPLAWKVPYCERCKAHAAQVTNLLWGIIFLAILMPVVLVIALGAESSTLIFILLSAVSAVVGVILYQALFRLLISPKMTGNCAHHAYAVFAADDKKSVFFHFYNEEQATIFARMNNAELMDAEKPNFWKWQKE